MKTIKLKGSLRENIGKSNAKNLRKEKLVPCVMYGQGENLHFQIEEKEFNKVVFTADAYVISFDIDGKKADAIVRDVQYHPVTDRIIHADFYEVNEKSPVWIMLPVAMEGASIGVLKGGRLVQKMRKIKVKGIPGDLPEHITVDISKLDIGKSIKIKDLKFDKIEFLDPANAVVVLVKTARGVQTDAEAEGEEAEGEEAAAEGGESAPAEESAE
jgi:large subunit ribosomal protein L25